MFYIRNSWGKYYAGLSESIKLFPEGFFRKPAFNIWSDKAVAVTSFDLNAVLKACQLHYPNEQFAVVQ